jgi:hypothetical protein
MTVPGCEQVRDQLPDWVAGRQSPGVGAHLVDCLACRAEVELLVSLRSASPPLPAGLEARVLEATRARLPLRVWGNTRQLALAAALVGAIIGGSLLIEALGQRGTRQGAPAEAASTMLPVLEDPALFGGSVISNLTEAELESLLARMGSKP